MSAPTAATPAPGSTPTHDSASQPAPASSASDSPRHSTAAPPPAPPPAPASGPAPGGLPAGATNPPKPRFGDKVVAFLLDLERVFEAIGRTSDRAVDTGSKLTFGGLCLILMVLLAVGFVEAHLTSWPIGGGRHGVGRVAEGNQPAVNPAPAQMARVGTAPAAAASAVAPAPAAATIQPIVVLIPMLESRDLDGLEPAPGGGPMWTVSQPDDGAELKPRLLAASRERVGGGGGITFVPWVAGVAASGLQSRRAVPPAEFTMNSGGIAYRYLRQPLAPDELRPAEPAPDAMAEAEPERAHRAGGLRRAARGPARETDEADAAPAGQPAAGP